MRCFVKVKMLFITWKPQTMEGLYFLRCSSPYAPSSKTKSSNNTTYLIERKGTVHNHREEVIMEYYEERGNFTVLVCNTTDKYRIKVKHLSKQFNMKLLTDIRVCGQIHLPPSSRWRE